ncbi:MAG: AAA family ATPase [Vampirovibrionales bacterium]|nr:AAA family ATPase [Vampirovibrionales bacterium]
MRALRYHQGVPHLGETIVTVMRVLIVTSHQATQLQLQQQLEGLSCVASITISSLAENITEQNTDWSLAVIDCTDTEAESQALISQWSQQYPNRWCVALHNRMDADIILGAVRAGAKEFVHYPFDSASLTHIVERCAKQSTPPEAPTKPSPPLMLNGSAPKQLGSLIGVFSPKGGGGGTTVAVNVAHQLSLLSKQPVAIIDLNPQYEGFGHAFNQPFKHALGDVARTLNTHPEGLDTDVLQKLIHEHPSGLHLLAVCKSVHDDNPLLSDGLLTQTLKELQRLYAYVVVDCPSQWVEDTHQRLFAMANHMLVVSMMDLPSLSRTQQYLSLVDEYLDPKKIRLVLNRYNLSAAFSINNQQLEEAFGLPAYGRLTNDWTVCVEAASLGQLLTDTKPGAPLVKDLQQLAEALMGVATNSTEKTSSGKQGGWLSRVTHAIRHA